MPFPVGRLEVWHIPTFGRWYRCAIAGFLDRTLIAFLGKAIRLPAADLAHRQIAGCFSRPIVVAERASAPNLTIDDHELSDSGPVYPDPGCDDRRKILIENLLVQAKVIGGDHG